MKKKIKWIIVIIIIIAIVLVVRNIITGKNYDYEIVEVETYNYFKYKEDGNYGVIDRNGNIVLQAEYETIIIPNPDEDIFICSNGEENIVLNSSQEELFTEYDNIEAIKIKNIASILCYEKSVLKYEQDGQYGLIDFEGNKITQNLYDSIENLLSTEGKFLVSLDEKYGVINLNGEELVRPEYDEIQTDKYYSEENGYTKSGFIVAVKNDDGYKYGYINYRGDIVLDTKYSDISRVTTQEEIYLIAATNGQYGFYKDSKELIDAEYQEIIACDNNALIIQKNSNYGIANLEGEILVETAYSSIEEKGIYLYAKNSNENKVYDSSGNVVDINFNEIVYETDNSDYRISTLVNNNVTYYGIENSGGEVLVENTYSYIEYAYGEYFIAKDEDGNFGVINYEGNVLIDFEHDEIQKLKNKNVIQVLDTGTSNIKLYSVSLTLICDMENATLINGDDYIEIYNEDVQRYYDSDGNEIDLDSSSSLQNVPDTIGNYTKVQTSLDDIYYE